MTWQAIETLENLDWETCLSEAEAAYEQATGEALSELAARAAAEAAAQAEMRTDDREIPW
jgi:hypothetical protein